MSITPAIRVVINDLNIGGTERQLALILPRLVNLGCKIKILCLGHNNPLATELLASGIDILTPKNSGNWAGWCLLIKDFWQDRKSISHFFLPKAYIMGMLASLITFNRAPKIMSRRSLNNYQTRHFFLTKIERWLHKRVDLIICNAKAILSQLNNAEGVPFNKLGLVYNGIELPDSVSNTALKKLPLKIITIANFIDYKGHQDILLACSTLPKTLDWQLLCVGQDHGKILGQLKHQAVMLGISDKVKWIENGNVPVWLKQSDIGILASHQEGCSNAILEMMAHAKPVIATDVGGNPELVMDGITGYLVPVADPKQLATKLIKLITCISTRLAFGINGRNRVAKYFSLDSSVTQHREYYIKLLR